MDLNWLPAFLLSLGTLIGGILYAKKKGLPDMIARADRETTNLVRALEGQLALANAELTKLKPQLAAAEVRIQALEDEVDRLERRIVKMIVRQNALEKS